MENDDIQSNIIPDKYLIKSDDYEFLFIIDLDIQNNIDTLLIQALNKNNNDKYKIAITSDDIISTGLNNSKSLMWFKMILQLGLEKLMKNNKKSMINESFSQQSSKFDIDTQLLTIGMNRLRIVEKIRDMRDANVSFLFLFDILSTVIIINYSIVL